MLFTQLFAVGALLFGSSLATPVKRCYGAEVVIYARGTDPYATSSTNNNPDPTDKNLAAIASQGVPKASVTALAYPASGIAAGSNYQQSWQKGIDNLQALIKNIVDNSCSGTKIVLLGYSQGGSVITGAVAGGQGRPKLTGQYLSSIAGGIAIADPSYAPNINPLDSLSVNATKSGSFQDGTVQQDLNTMLGSKFRSLCEKGDRYCQNDASDANYAIHLGEEKFWTNDAVKFLQSLGL